MKKEILLKNEKVEYRLKKSRRARNISLTIGKSAELSVTIPFWADENRALEFILKKADWILQKMKYFKDIQSSLLPERSRKDYLKCKELAREITEKKLEYFNQFYNFSFNRISIRNQKTRWGSCSRNGNLNFSYRIAYLPEKLCDYIIVHELCHLSEFNHSKKFWELVAKTVPDYKEVRRKIRREY